MTTRQSVRLKRRSKGREERAIAELMEIERTTPTRRARRSQKEIRPLTKAQGYYDQSISANVLTFGLGPAGTGKTWWAAMRAAKALDAGDVERIIITRPALEAGEELGFLPGELNEKYEPYFRPVRDALVQFLGAGPLEYHLKNGTIEARPLAYMRGATFENAFVLLDEAQNTTVRQMKLLLTRIGEGSKVVVDGDLGQIDLPRGVESGLQDALDRLMGKPDVGVVAFERADIVRSGFVRMICDAYDE